MQFDDKIPIYFQIKGYINREIITGELRPGAQLPPVRQLAIDLTVNVNTIQRALSELTAEGVIVTQRGRGNFVTEDTKILAELKQGEVTAQLATTYDSLAGLGLTPAKMVQDLRDYIADRVAKGKEDAHA